MANTETLEQIAELLPSKQREEFLAMLIQFKTVPDDDEYLQILKAIGFMTLLWKEVPKEIKTILEGANPISDTCQSVAGQLRQAVTEAIPSCEDLKLISQRLENHDTALKRILQAGTVQQPGPVFLSLLWSVGVGAAFLGFLFHDFIQGLFFR